MVLFGLVFGVFVVGWLFVGVLGELVCIGLVCFELCIGGVV